MSLQYYLRLPLVCLILSVVGCFPELSVGDITENDPKINKLALESFRSVNPAIQTPIRRTLQKNVEQFNNRYQLQTINSSAHSQRNYGNARNPSFSPTETKVSASAIYYSSIPKMISSNVNNTNNLGLSRYNDGVDAKRSYAFQTVQREQNPLYFTGNQKRFSGINLPPWLKNKGPTNGVRASFGDQHLSKSNSEMYLDSSRPLGLNEPYLRETISAQPIIRPAQTERLPTNYMSGSSTVTYDTRYKSDGGVLFPQNNGQNQNVLRKVVPVSASLSILRANGQASKSLPRDSSAGGEVISYENMRDVALSKVFKPPGVQTPITPVFKKSNSNGGQSIFPSRKAQIFSSQPVQAKQSNSERVASSNLQRSFVYGNVQSSSTQSRENSMPIQMFPSQNKYYNLGKGLSAIRPSETSGVHSYKGFFSNENGGIRSPTSVISNQPKQGTSLTQQMRFAMNPLFSEHDSRFKQPDTTTNSLTTPTRHNTHKKTDLNSSSQSAVQSLFTEIYQVPGHTMKNVHRIIPSVSNTQGTSKNSGMSSSQNRPYYLTSKKPFAFRSFTFVPTLQKSGREVEATQEGKRSGENVNKSVYVLPSPQSGIYRATDINRYKTNGYRSAGKHYSNILPPAWTSETSKKDIDLRAVGVSQGSRPTSSFVVGRYVNAFNKVSSKSNLKPLQFSDIVGSASFIKPPSAGSKAPEEVDHGSIHNHSNSIPLMEERIKELLFDTTVGPSLTSALQNETDEGRVDSSGPELMTTAAIGITTESQLSFTEESTRPQPTVYVSEPQLDPTTPTAEGTDPFYEGTLTPNTTELVTMSSE